MRRLTGLVIGLCMLWPLVAGAADSDERIVEYEFQVFRLSGAFRSETSLSAGVWGKNDENRSDRRDLVNNLDAVTLLDKGSFSWGRDCLQLNDKGCFWNSRKLDFAEGRRPQLSEGKIRVISSLSVVRPLEKLIRLKIDSDSPFQYMERKSDGSFVLKETTLPVGMDVEIRAEQGKASGLRITYFELELRSVGSREPIEGVRLSVGKPQLKEWEYVLRFNAELQRGYGVLIRPQGTTGAMLIRVAINEYEAGE